MMTEREVAVQMPRYTVDTLHTSAGFLSAQVIVNWGAAQTGQGQAEQAGKCKGLCLD